MTTYSSNVQAPDGFFRPCFKDANKVMTCTMDAEPMYKVHNLNAPLVAGIMGNNFVQKDNYLVPTKTFDTMINSLSGPDLVLRHYYMDTHVKASPKDNITSDLVTDKPCIRLEPCVGPAARANHCCKSLLPFLTQDRETNMLPDAANLLDSFASATNALKYPTSQANETYMKRFNDMYSVFNSQPPATTEDTPPPATINPKLVWRAFWIFILVILILAIALVVLHAFKRAKSAIIAPFYP